MPSSEDTILDLKLAQKQTVAELRAVAKKKGITLTGITRKADIIAALAGKKKSPVKSKPKSRAKKPTKLRTSLDLAKKINKDRAKLIKEIREEGRLNHLNFNVFEILDHMHERTKKEDLRAYYQEARKALLEVVEAPVPKKKSPAKKKSPKKTSGLKKIYLLPYLNDGHATGKSITTGNAKKDALVKQRLLKDYTHVRDVFGEDLNTRGYHFDGKHIIIDIEDSRSKKEIEKIIDDIIEMGPDTWMEGDIVILDEDEAKGTKLKGLTELMFNFIKIV